MGTLNKPEFAKTIEKIKDGLCPICDSKISADNKHNLEQDCFEYKCEVCSPNGCIISIGGGLIATSNYKKIIDDSQTKARLQKKIMNCKEGVVKISRADFIN